MKPDAAHHLDATFLALSDPTRRAILARLAHGDSGAYASVGMKVLERAGLISAGQNAQRRPRRLEGKSLAEASAWIEQYRAIWEANFERLDRLLAEMQHPASTSKRRRKRAKP